MRTAPRDAETHADDPFAARAHASRPERRVDAWRSLHDTFVREAKEAGTAGRPRCRTLFLGDSITEAMRGSQFGELYDELAARRAPRGSTASRLCVSVCGRAEPPMRFSECRVYPKLDGIQGL